MNIYKLNSEEVKRQIIKFNKTSFGLTTFVLSYSLSIILLATLLMLTILFLVYWRDCMWCYLPILLVYVVLLLITFILGSIHYYNELKQFVLTVGKKD